MKILFIGLVWPEPTSSAAGWRILHLCKAFSRLGEVHFASAAVKSDYSYKLNDNGIKEHTIVLNDSSFDTFIQKLQPEIVIFDRFMIEEQYGWRVAEYCPSALRILDTEDLHFLRQAREEVFKKKSELNLYSNNTKRELASILRSDFSIIISKTEIDILTQTFNISKDKLVYVPFQEGQISDSSIGRLPKFEDRSDFVFIGNFIHQPNFKTVEVLKKEIWPMLRKQLPAASLHIYGAYPSEKVLQLHKVSEKFEIKGRAKDARETLSHYKVLIAPIPFGAGTKGKFIDAMAVGTPSVTTSVGAEDMSMNGIWPGFIEDNPELFVEACVRLYTDSTLWRQKQREAYHLFNSTVGNLTYTNNMLQYCRFLLQDIAAYRQRHYISEILLQQQLNASKYMSLWIEQKNKK